MEAPSLISPSQIIKENRIENFIGCCEASGAGNLLFEDFGAGRPVHYLVIIDRGEMRVKSAAEDNSFKGPGFANIASNARIREISYNRSFHGFLVGIDTNLLLDIFRHRNPFPSPFKARFRVSGGFLDIRPDVLKIILQDCRNLLGALGNKSHRLKEELNYAHLYILLTDLADIVWEKMEEGPEHKMFESRSDAIFMDFINDLGKNVEKETGVEFYAARQFISKQYLSAVVRKKSGLSISRLIAAFRNEKAMKYILDPALSIKQAAVAMHFPDEASFCKFFRKHNGTTPAAYRKHLRTTLLTSLGNDRKMDEA